MSASNHMCPYFVPEIFQPLTRHSIYVFMPYINIMNTNTKLVYSFQLHSVPVFLAFLDGAL